MDTSTPRLKATVVVDQPEWMDDDEWAYREEFFTRCSEGLKSMGLSFSLSCMDPMLRFMKGEIDMDELSERISALVSKQKSLN